MKPMTDDVRAALSGVLDERVVKRNPSGFDYVDGFYVVDQANRIFGFDGWKHEIVDGPREVYRGTRPGKDGENHVIVLTATVRVYALGTSHDGVGTGVADGGVRALSKQIETAVKDAETDGLKRAIKNFGYMFGLALYDKTQANVGLPEEPEKPKAAAPPSIVLSDEDMVRVDEWMQAIASADEKAMRAHWQTLLKAPGNVRAAVTPAFKARWAALGLSKKAA